MRVCVIGCGPWPLESGAVVTGPSIRLRQFIEPLLAARHEVVAILLEETRRSRVPIEGVIAAEAFPPEEILEPGRLAKTVDLSFVKAVFGVGSLMPCASAARLATQLDAACWIDFFGDPLAELHASQLRQGGTPDATARDHIWKFVRETILRGDSFSTVSAPQRHALLGQLGLLGRFGANWDVCRRLHEVPCAVPKSWIDEAPLPPFPAVLIERGMNTNSRYVFFGGSWNVWLDEVTMSKALALALEEDPKLRFVSCGIPTGRAGEQIRRSLFKELESFEKQGRALDLPPQPGRIEEALLAHAGACLSLDRAIPEAELGSRNRLLSMVRWGARPVVSMVAGVEMLLVAEGLASGIDGANAQRAAKEILAACARKPDERETDRRAGLRWLRTVTFEETLRPILEWIDTGATRWPALESGGILDRWAALPANHASLQTGKEKKRSWFNRE